MVVLANMIGAYAFNILILRMKLKDRNIIEILILSRLKQV